MKTKLLPALALIALPACSQDTRTPEPAAADPQAVLSQIHEVEDGQLASMERDDLDGAVAVYAPDAVVYYPDGSRITGPENIRAAMAGMLQDEAFALEPGSRDASRNWVSSDGRLAVTSMEARYTHAGKDGETLSEPVVNQTVWRKGDDGRWTIASDINFIAAETDETADE